MRRFVTKTLYTKHPISSTNIMIQPSAISLRRYAYLGIGVWSYGIVVYVVVVFDLTNIDIDIEGLGYIY